MYKLLLILKYLGKRRIAWVSLAAVMLCTAMVLIVISVMGGWLNMFRESVHNNSGDIIIHGKSITGFSRYEEMIGEIRKVKGVKDAAPILHSFGLININNMVRNPVQVYGYPDNIGNVNNFSKTLHLNGAATRPFALRDNVDHLEDLPDGFTGDANAWKGMIVSPGVVGMEKQEDGTLVRLPRMYHVWVNMTYLPISEGSALDMKDKVVENYWIVDDARTGSWVYDNETVYVRFGPLQRLLKMDEREFEGENHKKFKDPARTNDVQISVNEGFELGPIRDEIRKIVNSVYVSAGGPYHHDAEGSDNAGYPYTVETWQQINAQFIGAIEHEKLLVTILFSIISIVAIFLIFCIFYMIVMEKTRDIGIIKSVGATSQGVAGIFLGYGLAIGIVGAGLGFLGGWLVVHYINTLHKALGKMLGIVIWDPKVYQFDSIPSQMNPREVVVILAIAVLSAVIGALVPAIRAARMHPVEALRWE